MTLNDLIEELREIKEKNKNGNCHVFTDSDSQYQPVIEVSVDNEGDVVIST